MEDLTGVLSSILNDPQKMQQLRSAAEALGLQPPAGQGDPGTSQQTASDSFDPAVMAQMLSALQSIPQNQNQNHHTNAAHSATSNASGGGLFNSATLASLTDIVQTFNTSDKNMDLLRSLKPHFSEARAGRIDDAVRILQILRVWPKIRDSGLLGSLGALLGGNNRSG